VAFASVKKVSELEGGFVLAPERYDPRRESLLASAGRAGFTPLRRLAASVRQTVTASSDESTRCLVLDTSDAREGVVVHRKAPAPLSGIGSAKKIVEPGDVIVSRLRPYLRQAAYVDRDIRHREDGVLLICSTEFFVLRAVDGGSAAFLVPLLLSEEVQKVLAAAQEGGHHPRFNERTLLGLPVPKAWVERREELSREVERAVKLYRQSEGIYVDLVADAQRSLEERSPHPGSEAE